MGQKQWFQNGLYCPIRALRYKGAAGGSGVAPSEHVLLFTTEVTLDQTLGNWYQFIKPIHRIKNLLILQVKAKLFLCLTNQALRHEGVWESRCVYT
jgi:hypothetical protein